MSVIVLGLSHHTAPVQLREKFAVNDTRMPEILQRLRAGKFAEEAVILSTCNRVEVYAATSHEPGEAFAQIKQLLAEVQGFRDPVLEHEIYCYSEPNSLEHLFKVACGLDSMVLGETEILGQLKHAYELALKLKSTGPKLNKAFQTAFHTAKAVRSETNIQRGSISVASVAVELAEKIFSSLEEHQVMIIGAGDTGEKTARALLSRGAHSLLVSNRSFDRAEALARELNGEAVRFENWPEYFGKVDIVISSTAAPHYILDVATLKPLLHGRKSRPLLLIDIAVPRDIAPEVNLLNNVYLYNIDDLQAIAEGYLKQRQEEVVRCEQIISSKVKALLGARRPPHFSPGVKPAFE